ncbi:acylphosphatase [Methylocapsa sp. D3K7]|uniref:acylphosphatase n=1 Tax=Methylocapsa sp. D3K7 TaxID=3041435 RepID=UPI00244ED543|nr:acylphosphatase [Methylocapsa sp. D3K7]WGJ14094.1 acylphosphatase [Methylocapsa sp. D3K7]
MVRPSERIVQVTISGRVQGVGYRFWVEREAAARGIRGWVRNRSNGDVEALFAGDPDAVEALCAACWRGPSHARVAHVEVTHASAAALAELGAGFCQIATL